MPGAECPADFNLDEVVDGTDLTELIAAWGGSSAKHDLDEDGTVGGGDLSIFLAAWGVCPE